MTATKFHKIFELEIAAITKRREKNGRPPIVLEQEDGERDGTPIMRPAQGSTVIGLALSGGGIRSSAFCLGAMQALNAVGIINKTDYLSTVSGGGYIGTSMTAAMTKSTPAGRFPFASELRKNEPPGLQHIRDHSNYLFPQGLLNIFSNVVVYLRGLAANAVILLPWLLLSAAFTIWSNPNVDALAKTNVAGYLVHLPVSVRHLGLTLNAFLAFVVLLAIWALWRSTPKGTTKSDVGFAARSFGILLIAVLLLAFIELQPLFLYGMFKGSSGGYFAKASSSLKSIAEFLVSIGTVFGFLGRFLGDALKRSTEKPGFAPFVTRIAIKFAMYLAGMAVPLALWLGYLYLSYWGIQNCSTSASCTLEAPTWLVTLAAVPFIDSHILTLYLVAGVALLLVSLRLKPNANSLHRLYRDRLSKAFLFNPSRRTTIRALPFLKRQTGVESAPQLRNSDLQPLDQLKVSEISTVEAPYHLINAALNIGASKYANRRGRNADFFIFSPLFSGSEATGYVETSQLEGKMKGFTAASAMATSGAAASSNMGSATIKPLVPTLAILNIRLGYWCINPAMVAGALRKSLLFQLYDHAYFLNELLGLLREDSEKVYLTDGGHLENLGIYELLRRRCKLIIAVDAEADPDMSFKSLVTLERYARIDFGIRIDLPWAAIRDVSRDASAEILKSGGLPFGKAPHGPHCALGAIYYPQKTGDSESRRTGVLLYIKSSCTGDENDYVIDYKRRNPTFPHESTIDQLFTEEQFEVYRALGFHAVNSAFELVDEVSMKPKPTIWQGPTSTIPLEKLMRDVLIGSCAD
jgi:predicted acylesterase/phospholipase RssA